MAYCFFGSMVFRQIDEEIRFYKDLMIHVLDMAVSVVAYVLIVMFIVFKAGRP